MGANQTTVQNEKDVRIGSAALFFSTNNGSSFTNLGLANDIVFTEEVTPIDSPVNNGSKPKILRGVASQTATVTANLLENSFSNVKAIRGGIDVLTNTTDTPVVGASHTFSSGDWKFTQSIAFPNMMASVPTALTVTGSVDTSTWVLGTDYDIVYIDATTYGISVIDSATVTTETQDVVVSAYTYTPIVATEVTTGGLVEQDDVWIRLFNRVPSTADATDALVTGITLGDAIYRTIRYDFYYGTVSAGDAQTYKDKNDTDPALYYPLAMAFENHPDRSAGDQLYKKKNYIELQSAVTL